MNVAILKLSIPDCCKNFLGKKGNCHKTKKLKVLDPKERNDPYLVLQKYLVGIKNIWVQTMSEEKCQEIFSPIANIVLNMILFQTDS